MKYKSCLMSIVFALTLIGCKDDTSVRAINYSQIRNTDGYIQAVGENKPFTGVVANIPYREIDLTLKIAHAATENKTIARFIPGQVLPTKGYCAASFQNGQIQGPFFCDDAPLNTDEKVQFDPNIHRVTGVLSNGQLTDTLYIRNQNGVTTHQIELLNGEKHGQYIQKYDDGTPRLTSNYSNGILDGSFELYHANGKIQGTTRYRNGVLDGWAHLYFDNGLKNTSERYENGICVEKINYYPGHEQTRSHYIAPTDDSERATYIAYYENGSIKEQGWVSWRSDITVYPHDEKIGFHHNRSEITYFDENGIKTHTITKGVRPESRIEYASDGQKTAFYTLSGERESGPYELYYPDGRIRERGQMYNGNKDEILEAFDERGNLIPGESRVVEAPEYVPATPLPSPSSAGFGYTPPSSASAQQPEITPYTYLNGTEMVAQGHFVNGQPVGDIKGYYEGGELMLTASFTAQGKPVGTHIMYYTPQVKGIMSSRMMIMA